MLKANWRLISRLERLGDIFLIVVAFMAAYYLRDLVLIAGKVYGLPVPQDIRNLAPIREYLIVLGMAVPTFYTVLTIFGAYQRLRFSSILQIVKTTVLASCVTFLCLGSFLFLLKLDLSRSYVGVFCAAAAALIIVERTIVLKLLQYWRRQGRNFRNVVIVGTGEQAQKLAGDILSEPELGVRLVGFVSYEDQVAAADGLAMNSIAGGERRAANGAQLVALSSVSQVVKSPLKLVATRGTFEPILKRFAVDEVLFTEVVANFSVMNELAQIAVDEGIRVTLAADFFSVEILKSEVSYFHSVPLIHYQPSPGDPTSLLLKRAIDITVSASMLLALLVPFVVIAGLIKFDSEGPVFFRQRRVGLNGRRFTLLKFRSMVKDAEKLLPQLRYRNEMAGPVFKIKDDPRVTAVGRWMRRFSIDELPQLINVLKGDMSLVGPRPPLPEEVSLYERKQRRRLSMRPGITCIWQVSGRNEIPDFERWAELDLQYIDHWSLGQDLRLLLRTIPAVLSGFGAR